MMARRASHAAVAVSTTACLLACGAARTQAGEGARALATSGATAASDTTLDTIDRTVREHFYAPAVLVEVTGRSTSRRRGGSSPRSLPIRAGILERLVASLRTSHTEYIAPTSPRVRVDPLVFDPVLRKPSPKCPDLSKLPPLPVQSDDIDVWWKALEGHWFVGGVLEGGTAEHAGLLLGDEVVLADGRPFSPVESLAGKAGQVVRLSVRRSGGAPLVEVVVTPAAPRRRTPTARRCVRARA